VFRAEDIFFRQAADGYSVLVLGKTGALHRFASPRLPRSAAPSRPARPSGEPRAGRKLLVQLQSAFFSEPIEETLQSDEQGRVLLGPLPHIRTVSVSAVDLDGLARTWEVRPAVSNNHDAIGAVHALAGQTISLPYTVRTGAHVRRWGH
jgi:hypothetical protein